MPTTLSDVSEAFAPEQLLDMLVRPLPVHSVALQALIEGSIYRGASEILDKLLAVEAPQNSGMPMAIYAENASRARLPIFKSDPSAEWVAEGQEIPLSNPELTDDADNFHKVAGLLHVTAELLEDNQSKGLAEQLGQGLVRDIARKIDAAFFGARGDNTLAPRGLGDLEGVTELEGDLENLDIFTEAVYDIADKDARIGSFVANPKDAKKIALLKEQSGSNRTLLTGRLLVADDIPVLASKHVQEGTIWGIPANGLIQVPIRQDVKVAYSETGPGFTSDTIYVRGTMRLTTLFAAPEAVAKIAIS